MQLVTDIDYRRRAGFHWHTRRLGSGIQNELGRSSRRAAHSQSSSQNRICLFGSFILHCRPRSGGLRREFASDLTFETVEHITFDSDVAIVTAVGEKLRGISGIVGRMFGALDRHDVSISRSRKDPRSAAFPFS